MLKTVNCKKVQLGIWAFGSLNFQKIHLRNTKYRRWNAALWFSHSINASVCLFSYIVTPWIVRKPRKVMFASILHACNLLDHQAVNLHHNLFTDHAQHPPPPTSLTPLTILRALTYSELHLLDKNGGGTVVFWFLIEGLGLLNYILDREGEVRGNVGLSSPFILHFNSTQRFNGPISKELALILHIHTLLVFIFYTQFIMWTLMRTSRL